MYPSLFTLVYLLIVSWVSRAPRVQVYKSVSSFKEKRYSDFCKPAGLEYAILNFKDLTEIKKYMDNQKIKSMMLYIIQNREGQASLYLMSRNGILVPISEGYKGKYALCLVDEYDNLFLNKPEDVFKKIDADNIFNWASRISAFLFCLLQIKMLLFSETKKDIKKAKNSQNFFEKKSRFRKELLDMKIAHDKSMYILKKDLFKMKVDHEKSMDVLKKDLFKMKVDHEKSMDVLKKDLFKMKVDHEKSMYILIKDLVDRKSKRN